MTGHSRTRDGASGNKGGLLPILATTEEVIAYVCACASLGAMTTHSAATFGQLFRDWREARNLSQLGLAVDAEISQKHLSFIESGRATPSREMVLRLAEHLDIPLRERNALLLAAGYAPIYPEHALDAPALAEARKAIEQILKGHEPYPALAIDRHWNLVTANAAALRVMEGVAPDLLNPPINVMRISLHPRGLAPRVENFSEWRGHLLERLRRQFRLTRDQAIADLLQELLLLPTPDATAEVPAPNAPMAVVVPFRLATKAGTLSFISTTTFFGTPAEITLSELTLEAFYPADAQTAEILRQMAGP